MGRGPKGIFAEVPGLGESFKLLTQVVPLGRAEVIEREGSCSCPESLPEGRESDGSRKRGWAMSHSGDANWRDRDAEGEDPDEDPGEEAARPFANSSFRTPAEEQEARESLDERLKEEQPTRTPRDRHPSQLVASNEEVTA